MWSYLAPKDGVLWNSHPTVEPSLHFLAAQGEIARIKEEIEKGKSNYHVVFVAANYLK